MCYAPDAIPPVPAAVAVPTSAAALTLTSADGTEFAAFDAVPETPAQVGVLLLPDNRGLSGFYQELAVTLAGLGFPTVAVDYFGRTAGTDLTARVEFPFLDHLRQLTRDGLHADFAAGIAHLRARTPAVVSLGFCLGGRFAFQTAAARFGLAGAIGFYGHPGELFGAPGPTQQAAELTAPVLGLFGAADEGIPAAEVASFDTALTVAGVPHELVSYPGADHGFFEHGGHPEASADAWTRVLAFLRATRLALT